MQIYFDNPWYLVWCVPIIVIMLVLSMKYMFTRNFRVKLSQVLLRFLLSMLLILALTGISVKLTGKDVTTIFLVDASDSVKEKRSEVVDFVNEACKNKGKHDYVGVITFGSDTRVEQFVTKDVNFHDVQADVKCNATNLEEAVNMALAQLPEDNAKRIVLITDGNENEGTLKNTANDVISKGCDFQIKKINENIANEVYVANMTVPEQVGIGENFNIEVEVESNVASPAKVSLYSGRTLKGQQSVNLQKGTNKFVFMDTQSDEGLKTYRVVVESEDDTVSVNNEFSAYTNCETTLPILLVEGESGNSLNMMKILDSIGIYYDIATPATVPNNVGEMSKYSAIMLINVYATDLRNGFMDNIEEYVRNYGGGFIITGGPNSYAVGGYRDTPLEEVSPVYMELSPENELPSMAFEMVIDHSGSMDDGNGFITCLDLAKESAVAALDNLRAEDYVGVIAFDDTWDKVVPIKHPDDVEGLKKSIYGIGLGGGTSIYPALEQAVLEVNGTNAMVKHIILLTDGQDYMDDYDDLKKIINDAGITVSSVAIGSGCNSQLLESIANDCGGRYFYTDLDTDVPRIFAQEVFLSSNNYIINEEFTPVLCGTEMKMNEICANGIPNLYGYIATTPKERSIPVLETPGGDPLLYAWQYGLGKAVAYTSDVTGEWSSAFSSWEENQHMWYNIIKYATEYTGMEGSFAEVKQQGSKATITYTTDKIPDKNVKTDITAIVYDDEGNEKEITMEAVRPGVYETELNTEDTGVYTINIQHEEEEKIIGNTLTAAIMQYSLEYRFYPDNTLLDDYASIIGAHFVEAAGEVFATEPEFVKARLNLSTILLILGCLLLLLDIAARRFNLNLLGFIPTADTIANWKEKKANRAEKKLQKKLAKLEKKNLGSRELTDNVEKLNQTEKSFEQKKTIQSDKSVINTAEADAQKQRIERERIELINQKNKKSTGSTGGGVTKKVQPTEKRTSLNTNTTADKKATAATTATTATTAKSVADKPVRVFERKAEDIVYNKTVDKTVLQQNANRKPTQNKPASNPGGKTTKPKQTGTVVDANKKTRVWTRDN